MMLKAGFPVYFDRLGFGFNSFLPIFAIRRSAALPVWFFGPLDRKSIVAARKKYLIFTGPVVQWIE
jgi:hypothetical protein